MQGEAFHAKERKTTTHELAVSRMRASHPQRVVHLGSVDLQRLLAFALLVKHGREGRLRALFVLVLKVRLLVRLVGLLNRRHGLRRGVER